MEALIYAYAVPEAVAQALKLAPLRRKAQINGATHYLLSSQDLQAYGIDRAIENGAVRMGLDEARQLFNQK